jgi:serine incorporator 1/3
VSLGATIFFAFMSVLTAAVPITHLGGWLVKVVLYALVTGLAFLIDNDAMTQYALAARGFSVLFLLIQVLIIIDFAYNAHEWLVARMDATDARFEREGWEPGCCSNGWRVLYVSTSAALGVASIVGLALLYHYFGGACPLHNFYISETLVVGVLLTLVSMMNVVGKGLLPPTLILAYTTYLTYGAISNNPDTTCNPMARADTQSEASIYTGLVIAVLSVAWMAFSSAGSISSAVRMDGTQRSVDNPVPRAAGSGAGAGTPPAVSDWPGSRDKAAPAPGTAGAYQARGADGDDDDEEAAAASRPAIASSGAAAADADAAPTTSLDKPWLFHVVMALAAMYLAMVTTNWGSPSDANSASGNPELSSASMWARAGSLWAVQAVYIWTMIAPTCCPGREFGR